MSFVAGALLFLVAVVDELVLVLRGEQPTYVSAPSRSATRAATSRSDICRWTPASLVGGLLLLVMLLLLAGGVWIAMTLAIVGWIGQAFFTTTLPGKNLFAAFWESVVELGAGGAAAVHLDGRDPVPHPAVGGDVRRPARRGCSRMPGPADAHHHPRLRHLRLGLRLVGRHLRHHRQGRACPNCSGAATTRRIALGSLATAGTLGILIPPSITMVVYAVAADASIIRIFLAGFLPGFLLMALFSGYIALVGLRHPDQVPPAEPPTSFMREAARARASLIPCALLIVVHRLGAGGRLGHRHRVRGLRRAGLAGHRRRRPAR